MIPSLQIILSISVSVIAILNELGLSGCDMRLSIVEKRAKIAFAAFLEILN